MLGIDSALIRPLQCAFHFDVSSRAPTPACSPVGRIRSLSLALVYARSWVTRHRCAVGGGPPVQSRPPGRPEPLEGEREPMPTVADSVDAFVGGDTHVDECVRGSPVGAVLGQITIDNDEDGYAELVTWILRAGALRAVPGRVGGDPQLRRGFAGRWKRRDQGCRGRAPLARRTRPAGQVRP